MDSKVAPPPYFLFATFPRACNAISSAVKKSPGWRHWWRQSRAEYKVIQSSGMPWTTAWQTHNRHHELQLRGSHRIKAALPQKSWKLHQNPESSFAKFLSLMPRFVTMLVVGQMHSRCPALFDVKFFFLCEIIAGFFLWGSGIPSGASMVSRMFGSTVRNTNEI